MRYRPISSHVYKKNRDKFMSEMKKDSIAVFNSNDIYPIGADSTFPFEQHRDIFYLTGIDQEETILLLSPQAQEIKNREILFVKKTDKNIQIWEGPKLSKEDARLISGIEKILWLNEFDSTLKEITSQNNGIYLNKNEITGIIPRHKLERIDSFQSLRKNIQLILYTEVIRYCSTLDQLKTH